MFGSLNVGSPQIKFSRTIIKVFARHTKVFAHLFQKAAHSKARSLCRAPQSAKFPLGAFLFDSFFFCGGDGKRKIGESICFLFWLLVKFGVWIVGETIGLPRRNIKQLFLYRAFA